MKKTLAFLFLLFPSLVYGGMADYNSLPLFLTQNVQPNVLILLDNSNSMDEDFQGNAVTSYAANSKAVVARDVLLNLINNYQGKMRIGLMSYRVGSSVSSYYIHNWLYFASYEPKSYCPNPPSACVDYCKDTSNSSARTACLSSCQSQNAAFDVDYLDQIITNYGIGTAQRNKYCRLCYPKTQRVTNPTDVSRYVYYKGAGPFYAGSNQGTMFIYSSSYNANESPPAGADSYNQYLTKTGTSDAETGYSNYVSSRSFSPTDSDYALGYADFGRRAEWSYAGRTWFKNSSPGDGYLHVTVNDVEGTNLTNLLNKLSIQDETGYMSCSLSTKDTCSYIVNAGLTPIAGSLQTARQYINGTLSGTTTPIQYKCQKNYIILVTDGLPSVDKSGVANITNPDALMGEVLTELDSLRNITVTVDGASTAFDVKTFVVGVALTDEAKTKLDDMAAHGGTAVSGKAFYADNPTALEDVLNTIFADIVKCTASASAVSVLSTSAEGEGGLFQAYFTPMLPEGPREVYWLGFMQSLFLDQYGNIREDTANAGKLVLEDDYIIRFRTSANNDTVVDRYHDTNGDGEVTSGDFVNTVLLSEIKSIWEAGKNLALRTSSRNICTFVDYDNDTNVDSTEWGCNLFDVSDATTLRPYLNVDTVAEAENVIRFMRGDHIGTLRDRRLTVSGQADKVWKLGDIVYSTPSVLGRPMGQFHLVYGDLSYLPFIQMYKDRKTVVYVGANDGMIHAISAGYYHDGDDTTTSGITEKGWYSDEDSDTGQELWGYIPYNLFPHLRWFTGTDYTDDFHVYYVDLKSKLADARIFSPPTGDTNHPNGWGTILIGGMRFGGGTLSRSDEFISGTPETRTFRSAYFALDVTNPDSTSEYPKPLWEYTDANLGFTTSYPAIARVESGGVSKWFAIVGSGPAGPDAFIGKSNQNGYIYVINLADGTSAKIDTGLGNAFMGSPITVDIGLDNSVDVAYIGATYDDAGVWKGKIFRLKTNGSLNPADWVLSTFIDLLQPMTSAPSAAFDSFGHLWLYWGTGRYLSTDDITNTSTQRLYGAWDPLSGSISVGSDLVNVSSITIYEEGYTNTTGTMFQDVLNTVRGKKGWFVEMPAGEKSFEKPTIIGDIVLFTTFKPNTAACSYGGNSYLYALYYETGTAYKESVIGLNASNTITVSGDVKKEILKKTDLGAGMPTSVVIHAGREQGVKGMVQLGTGVVKEIDIDPATSPQSRVIFWREKTD